MYGVRCIRLLKTRQYCLSNPALVKSSKIQDVVFGSRSASSRVQYKHTGVTSMIGGVGDFNLVFRSHNPCGEDNEVSRYDSADKFRGSGGEMAEVCPWRITICYRTAFHQAAGHRSLTYSCFSSVGRLTAMLSQRTRAELHS